MPFPFCFCDALQPELRDVVHALLLETAERRPLTRLEVRLRCMTKRWPWREQGISASTYYRRKLRAAEAIKANPQKSDRAIAAEIGVDQKTVGAARRQSGEEYSSPVKQRMARAA